MVALTGMNYANKKTLYGEVKMSLKKFKGDVIMRTRLNMAAEHGSSPKVNIMF